MMTWVCLFGAYVHCNHVTVQQDVGNRLGAYVCTLVLPRRISSVW